MLTSFLLGKILIAVQNCICMFRMSHTTIIISKQIVIPCTCITNSVWFNWNFLKFFQRIFLHAQILLSAVQQLMDLPYPNVTAFCYSYLYTVKCQRN